MKSKIFLAALFAASLFGTTACSDFLNEDPKGKLVPGGYFTSQDELNMSLVSLFHQSHRLTVLHKHDVSPMAGR